MANGIKLGNLDISAFKVGSSDCKVYLGDTLLYQNEPTPVESVLGDVLMWDNVKNKLLTTVNGEWDSTTYPINRYEPIAINIYPASQASDGKNRFMALKWASTASALGSARKVNLVWGKDSTKAGDITSTEVSSLNGRENTDKVVAIMPGTSGNTQAEYPIFYAVNQFYTNGTSAGDWFVPSRGELLLYRKDYSSINNKITAIKSASSSIVDTVNGSQVTSTEYQTTNVYSIDDSGKFETYTRGSTYGVRGVIVL